MQQGEDAIMRNFAAQGGRGGGDAMKAIAEYGQNFASNEFDKYAQRQMGLAGAADANGMSKAGQLAGLATGYGQGAANLSQSYGQGMAGLATGQGQSLGDVYMTTGQGLAGLGMQASGINANLAGQQSGAVMAPVQYAGGAQQAQQNFNNTLLTAGGQVGAAYVGAQ
jgi:hypothetical protein